MGKLADINFSTFYCCVNIAEGIKPRVIENSQDAGVAPSAIACRPTRSLVGILRPALAAAAFLVVGTSSLAATSSGFTQKQAQQGASIYSQHCAQCHGAQLQGGAAPALSGSGWHASIGNRFNTSAKLLDYVSNNMPVNDPGGLSEEEYKSAVAFILARNGYDNTKPASKKLDQVSLTPVPSSPDTGQANLEIQNIGNASRTVAGKLPEPGRVNVSDQMMQGAANDKANWLLHGREYTNQRYSPLDQINSQNVGSLVPVALMQTGLVGSFEATPIVVNGVMYLTTPTVDRKLKALAMDAASGKVIWETSY